MIQIYHNLWIKHLSVIEQTNQQYKPETGLVKVINVPRTAEELSQIRAKKLGSHIKQNPNGTEHLMISSETRSRVNVITNPTCDFA